MEQKYKYMLWILFGIFLLLGCDKYLDVQPSKTTSLVPTTLEHLETLLNDYDSFYEEVNGTAIYSSDDYGLYKEIYEAKSNAYDLSSVEFATWDMKYLPAGFGDGFWSGEYQKIFIANMVLENLDRVSGDTEQKEFLEAEAHLIKAYSYWILANTYCLPYTEANKNEMGLVLKNSVSFEESTVRSTLEDTYEMIEKELKGALKLQNPLTIVNDKFCTWRGSKPAADALAARYYLFRNNYTEALKYSGYALEGHDKLMDYNTDMRYSSNKSEVIINPGEADKETVEIKYPYTHDNQSDMTDKMEWKEFYYFRMLSNASWWYIPSKELLALYDQDYDLRYKYHFVKNYSYDRGLTSPAYEYPGYVFFYKDCIPSGPTVAEMLLIKAECQARLGDYAEAMNTVNILREKRISSSAPYDKIRLSAFSKDEAVRKILEERRREMPFSMRWYDIRRFNNNEDSNDDVVLTREFYPYTSSGILGKETLKIYSLDKNSRRFAAPISNTEIESSLGTIRQNIY